MFYSLILFIIAATTQKPSDWLFTALFFPFTFFLNAVIKRLLYGDTHDKTKQEVGMYLLAIYMFISSLLFYARFYENSVLETAAYILIYYAVVVISLYTSRKLTLWSTFGMLVSMTIIHLLGHIELVIHIEECLLMNSLTYLPKQMSLRIFCLERQYL